MSHVADFDSVEHRFEGHGLFDSHLFNAYFRLGGTWGSRDSVTAETVSTHATL